MKKFKSYMVRKCSCLYGWQSRKNCSFKIIQKSLAHSIDSKDIYLQKIKFKRKETFSLIVTFLTFGGS